MIRKYLAVGALTGLAACSGGEFLFPGTDDGGGGGETDPIPESLANNLSSVVFDPAGQTLTVEISSLDTTPLRAVYTRRAGLDVPGYQAYAVQEDALDRMFVGLAARSADGTSEAVVAGDGGQFNRYFSGGYYARKGLYSAPPSGRDGPGTGQVSYAGTYAGLTNVGVRSSETIPVPIGTDPSLIPRQPARTSGTVFINANFADNSVNGAVYDRMLVDTGLALDSIVLLPTDITENGTFAGDVEYSDTQTGVGEYGGIFGGVGATSVSGIVALTEFTDLFENEEERGVFVLSRCDTPSESPICGSVAP